VGDQCYELSNSTFTIPVKSPREVSPLIWWPTGCTNPATARLLESQFFSRPAARIVTVRQLWERLPQTPGKEEVIAGVEVNLAGLLPRDTS